MNIVCILYFTVFLSDHNGVSSLKKIQTIKEEGEFEVEGAFGNPAAKEVLNKAKELQRYSYICM